MTISPAPRATRPVPELGRLVTRRRGPQPDAERARLLQLGRRDRTTGSRRAQDVYEWTGSGTPDLISTGGSPFDSSLLGASADGTDAFFFTRDTLVPQDKNGTLVKIYDARKGGGFEFLPTPERCKASDECHGAGSEPPGALPIATGAGDGGAHKAPKTKKPCPKGKKRQQVALHEAQAPSQEEEAGSLMNASARIATISLGLLALCLALAAPALATEPIESFSSTLSTDKVGGHPDIVTEFSARRTGGERGGPKRHLQHARGRLRQPGSDRPLHLARFRPRQCPSDSQAGLITLRAKYKGDPNYLLGTAPIYDIDPGAERPALFAFVVPTLDIPINIPVAVRTGGDYGLRFTVSNITQLTPLAEAKLTFWGFPALEAHDEERFPKGSPGSPAGCPGEDDDRLHRRPTPASHRRPPAYRQPDGLHRRNRCPSRSTSRPTRTPSTSHTARTPIRRSPTAKTRPSNRSSSPRRRRKRPTPPPASTSAQGSAVTRLRRHPVGDPFRGRYPARRADDQSGRRRRPERLHATPGQLRISEGPPNARTTPRSGQSRSTRLPSKARSKVRSTSANPSRATSTACS